MDEPKSLNSLFTQKIFRVPDYQRGYAWQISQLEDFWKDLINLSDEHSHYAGVLTLEELNADEIKKHDNEYWLVEDHSYKYTTSLMDSNVSQRLLYSFRHSSTLLNN